MLSLFKSKKQRTETIVETIEKIHNEFDSASEKLLAEAKAIIERNNCADKVERLKKLGFSKASPVSQAEEKRKQKELSDKIMYFQTHYPNYKFITEDLVKSICEKYGLVFGDASLYKGDIPEKNLRDIENFELREEDRQTTSNYEAYLSRRRMALLAGLNPAMEAPEKLETYKVIPSFKICAPEKDFDMAYMVKKGYKLEYDPIVLQPVSGGYLIVTKWGLEGQDPALTNENKTKIFHYDFASRPKGLIGGGIAGFLFLVISNI